MLIGITFLAVAVTQVIQAVALHHLHADVMTLARVLKALVDAGAPVSRAPDRPHAEDRT